MKRLNILLLSALAFVMTVASCSKSDDKAVAVTPVLKVPVGKFVFDTWTETQNGVTSEVRLAYKPECSDRRYFDLRADGTMEDGFVGTDVDHPCTVIYYQGTYTQTGNVMTTVEDGAYSDVYTVLAVTDTKLTIRRAYHTDPTHLITYTLIKQ